jgi:hypothetical protein
MATDAASAAQLAIISATGISQLVLSQKQAAAQEKAAEAESLIMKHQSEMQAFELEQGVISKRMEALATALNIDINVFMRDFVGQFAELNAKIIRTEANTQGIMADINHTNLQKEKTRTLQIAGEKIDDFEREGRSIQGQITAAAASSNLSLDSDTMQTIKLSIAAETDRKVSRQIIETGDHVRNLVLEQRKEEVAGKRSRILGNLESEATRRQGFETQFQLDQRIIEDTARISALESDAKNLETSAELVRISGVASANSAIAAGAVQASGTRASGAISSLQTLSQGFDNAFQIFRSNKQVNQQKAEASLTK